MVKMRFLLVYVLVGFFSLVSAFEAVKMENLSSLVGKKVYAVDNFEVNKQVLFIGDELNVVGTSGKTLAVAKTASGAEVRVSITKISQKPLTINLRKSTTLKQLLTDLINESEMLALKAQKVYEANGYMIKGKESVINELASINTYSATLKNLSSNLSSGKRMSKAKILKKPLEGWLNNQKDASILDLYAMGSKEIIKDKKMRKNLSTATKFPVRAANAIKTMKGLAKDNYEIAYLKNEKEPDQERITKYEGMFKKSLDSSNKNISTTLPKDKKKALDAVAKLKI